MREILGAGVSFVLAIAVAFIVFTARALRCAVCYRPYAIYADERCRLHRIRR